MSSEEDDPEADANWREGDLIPAHTPAEQALEVAGTLANLVPVLGGAVGSILSGTAQDRRWERVMEFLADVDHRIREVSDESRTYVRTEDFEELLEETLRRVARERSEQKRKVFARFLAGTIESPGEQSYDERLEFLGTLERMQPDHVRVLRAIMQPATPTTSMMGSGLETLSRRVTGMEAERIVELVGQLEVMRLVDRVPLNVTMTARGAEELYRTLTPFGRRFVRFLQDGDEAEDTRDGSALEPEPTEPSLSSEQLATKGAAAAQRVDRDEEERRGRDESGPEQPTEPETPVTPPANGVASPSGKLQIRVVRGGRATMPGGESGYVAEYEVLGHKLELKLRNLGTLLVLSRIRCEVSDPDGIVISAQPTISAVTTYVAGPAGSVTLHYPTEFPDAPALKDGTYRVRWFAYPSAMMTAPSELKYDVFEVLDGRIVE